LAHVTQLIRKVGHFPPGTSKANKKERRLFSHITRNWPGVSIDTLEIVVNLIAATRTETGLKLHAELHSADYTHKQKDTHKPLADVLITRDKFHSEWNSRILPQTYSPNWTGKLRATPNPAFLLTAR